LVPGILAIVKVNSFSWSLIFSILIMLIPAGTIAFELMGKKVYLVIYSSRLFSF